MLKLEMSNQVSRPNHSLQMRLKNKGVKEWFPGAERTRAKAQAFYYSVIHQIYLFA